MKLYVEFEQLSGGQIQLSLTKTQDIYKFTSFHMTLVDFLLENPSKPECNVYFYDHEMC